jgi:maltooligosyltrehalose trehalohydrolase
MIDRTGRHRRLPVGAEVLPDGSAHFRVWASSRTKVEVVIEPGAGSEAGEAERAVELAAEGEGYFSGVVAGAGAGTLYRYRLDRDQSYPDPASRFQPDGPHGPSQIVSPDDFTWTDEGWQGVRLRGQVIYEMHVGTFTKEGTWQAAARELEQLNRLGVTVIEIMPIADFAGRFGWGYDGVDLFAPTRLYGTPDDFRRFVDRAHAVGVGVILDVVYNHLGPDGCYVTQFSKDYFTDRHHTDWGDAINFDGENSGPVREFFIANAGYWITEFHLDGLRADATQNIYDSSADHILAAITRRVRESARGRGTIIVAENEPQHVKLIRPEEKGGHGMDALWNDDLHHSAMVALTGRNEAYYTDYLGKPQEFISAMKWGYLYQGQRYKWQKKRRGTPALDIAPAAFVSFIQNHDQVANSGRGLRCHELTSPGRYRAMTALLLLGPATPMLFQGQEFAASSPFLFFADHKPELAGLVLKGRRKFLEQFRSLATREAQSRVDPPHELATFERCKLDLTERVRHAEIYRMHGDLLKLRREDAVFGAQRHRGMDGAVIGEESFLLRFFADDGRDRLLLVNLGTDLRLDPAPEPLLAPPESMRWEVLWSSEDPRYGGNGTAPLDTKENWRIPGHAAVVLTARAATEEEMKQDEEGAGDE